MLTHWEGYAIHERPTCCRWCPCCAVSSCYDRKGSRDGWCNVLAMSVENLDGVPDECPGNVVVEVLR